MRDLMFWKKEAQKKLLDDRLLAMTAARMAMVRDESFRQEVYRLQWSRKLMDIEEGKHGR